jgi:hypothetical protein
MVLGTSSCGWLHVAHGLRLFSEFPIAEARPISLRENDDHAMCGSGDVVVRRGRKSDLPQPLTREWLVRNSNGISVATGSFGTVIYSYCGSTAWKPLSTSQGDPDEIIVSRGTSISTVRFNHTILHAFVPHLLALNGHHFLHASCVVLNDRAFLFSGESGAGKSTLAAGFAARGATVYSEDVIRIYAKPQSVPVVYPSYPGARLRSNSFLLPPEKRVARSGRFGLPKYRLYGELDLASQPEVEVAAVFSLGSSRQTRPDFRRLQLTGAIRPMLRASFLAALPRHVRSQTALSHVVALLRAVPAYEVRYRRSPEHFEGVVSGILDFAFRQAPRS